MSRMTTTTRNHLCSIVTNFSSAARPEKVAQTPIIYRLSIAGDTLATEPFVKQRLPLGFLRSRYHEKYRYVFEGSQNVEQFLSGQGMS